MNQAFLFVALAAIALLGCADDTMYDISRYVATIDVVEKTVTLDIAYAVRKGVKSDGFKFVDHLDATLLGAADGAGNKISARVVKLDETKLEWSFPPVRGPGQASVKIRFRAPGIVTRSGSHYVIDAPWIGVFRVPVRDATWIVIMPGNARDVRVLPSSAELNVEEGSIRASIRQTPMTEKSLHLDWEMES